MVNDPPPSTPPGGRDDSSRSEVAPDVPAEAPPPAAAVEPLSLSHIEEFLATLVQLSVGQRTLPLAGMLDDPTFGNLSQAVVESDKTAALDYATAGTEATEEEDSEEEDSDEVGADEGDPDQDDDPSEEPELDAFQIEPVSTHAYLWPLSTEAHWERLHSAFAYGRERNLLPWFRCLGILRGLEARTVVVETYYVCLDYKSEHAAFYAHLDAPQNSWAVRLHFFGETIDAVDDVVDLTKAQKRSYLGYIVCREGNLPLVGRTLIRIPAYLKGAETTAIDESVNFFGQKLAVRGVPFMQQDVRFANCSHVALWIIAYTAYRRGTTMRRLIADLVSVASSIQPLRPRVSEGLHAHQVVGLLGELGFRAELTEARTETPLSPRFQPPGGGDFPATSSVFSWMNLATD